MKRLLILLLSPLLIIGCKGIDTVLFQDTTMGFVQNDYSFLTDGGKVYDFGLTKGSIDQYEPGKRLLVACSVNTKVSETKYSATLFLFYIPICKDALKKSEVEDWEAIGHDKIKLNNGWLSGNYINLMATIDYSSASSGNHALNLIVDDVKSSADTLYVDFRHNANSDTETDQKMSFYASFPLMGYLKGSETTIAVQSKQEDEQINYINL